MSVNKLSGCITAHNIFAYSSAINRDDVIPSIPLDCIATCDTTLDRAINNGDDIFIGMAFFTRPANCIESINGSTRHF